MNPLLLTIAVASAIAVIGQVILPKKGGPINEHQERTDEPGASSVGSTSNREQRTNGKQSDGKGLNSELQDVSENSGNQSGKPGNSEPDGSNPDSVTEEVEKKDEL